MKLDSLGTIQIEKDCAIFSINPKIHDIKTIKKAAKSILEKAAVILDGDPYIEILVELYPKRSSPTKIAEEFRDLLIKCS